VTKPEPIPVDTPKEACIRAALARVIASRVFANSPQLGRFLTFVVDEALAGRGQRIKAYTIATDALGREASFDPQNDPIVRVEAGRLRQALDNYYATDGRDDNVIVDLPRGHYVPIFRRRPALSRFDTSMTATGQLLRRMAGVRVQLGVLVIVALLAAIGGVGGARWWQAKRAGELTTASIASGAATPRFSDNGLPVVYVRPIDVIGTPLKSIIAPAHLQTELCDALARFDEIIVVTDAACGGSAKSKLPPLPSKFNHVDYVVSGHLDYGDGRSVAVTLRLIDTSEGMIVWSRTFPPIQMESDADQAQDVIVRQAVQTIAQPTGIIQAHERSLLVSGTKFDPRYACLLDYNAYRLSFDPTEHERIKACLQQAIARDPAFSAGYAALARVYVRQFYTHFGSEKDEPKPLERALRLAQKATELNPASAEAYVILMGAQFARHDFTAARAAAGTAMMLNPNDLAVQAECAFMQLRLGDIDKAMPKLRDAITAGYAPSPIIVYALFAGAYLTGNLDEARRYADSIATDNFPLGLTAKALMAEKSGDHAGAARALDRIYALQPAWKTNTRGEFAKSFEDKRIVDRLTADLSAIASNATN
jgi:TolB-like protein